jgi:hypothetical protein
MSSVSSSCSVRDEVAGPTVNGAGGGPLGSDQRASGAHHRDPSTDHLSTACPGLGPGRPDQRDRGLPHRRYLADHLGPLGRRAQRYGLAELLPKGRRPPVMPTATPPDQVEAVLAEAVARPTIGAQRLVDHLADRGVRLSASGVQKILRRHRLGRRAQRVAALAQLTAATTGILTAQAKDGPFGCARAPAEGGGQLGRPAQDPARGRDRLCPPPAGGRWPPQPTTPAAVQRPIRN